MPRDIKAHNGIPRVLLLAGAGSYRRAAFAAAAARLGIEAIDVVDIPEPLESISSKTVSVDYTDADGACDAVAEIARDLGVVSILALDDSAAMIAATASQNAGIAHNDPGSVLASRDKLVMRQKMAEHGAPVPWFIECAMDSDVASMSGSVEFPCVIKPTRLSGSRGVIRADNAEEFVSAFERTKTIVIAHGGNPERSRLIVEQYLPGFEVAVEAILTDGDLQVLAIFDKPDPLEGPFFEETIYVTPSRLSPETQQVVAERTAEAADATGIRRGPVHAELRIGSSETYVIEIAGRSIGGMCSTVLEFGTGQSLEELILLNATGRMSESSPRRHESVGVMMIPIPKSGVLRCVDGIEDAKSVRGISDLQISAKLNAPISALPEGSSYLGFIFAKAETPGEVETALREAYDRLTIKIDTMIRLARAI